jgi:hypothetical protein
MECTVQGNPAPRSRRHRQRAPGNDVPASHCCCPQPFESHPNENRRAAHTSFIRAELSWATRFPRRCCDTVTALCRFPAHEDFSRPPHPEPPPLAHRRTLILLVETASNREPEILFKMGRLLRRFVPHEGSKKPPFHGIILTVTKRT